MAEKDFKVKHGLFVTDSANINNLTVRGDASVSGSITVTGNFVGEYAGFDSDFNQKTTTNLTEGDNLYYTTSRADSDFDSRLSTKSTNDLTEGDNLYYTTARADSDFDVRLVTKSTDDLTEGTSLYYTTARADSDFDVRLVTKSTDDLTEGTSLYYTSARADSDFDVRLATKSTDNLTEGDNLYYTTSRADSDFDVRLATKSTDNLTEGDNLYYTTARADSDFDVRLSTKSTDDLTEGDNLYYTTARADSDAKNAVSVTDAGGDGSISYNNATGTITYTGPSATETRAHLVAGTGVNYDSANGVVSIGQSVGTSDTVTFATVNTGQGANELYAMDQNVRTTDNVAFGQIDGDSATMGQINFKTDWVTDHITFSEGAVWYDPYHKNLNYYTDIDHPIEIGMQMVERVYNDTGSTILKGKPLYYSGNRVDTAGQESPTVALANATSATKYNVQGLAGEDIANGAYGLAVVSGVIDGFDTSGLNADANFFVGLEDGAVQNAPPSYPNYPMCLGWVIQSDASDGKVIINQQNHSVNTFRVQGDTHIGDDLVVDGNLTVKGTQTITSTENVSIGGNFQYLNAGNTIGEAGTVFVGTGLDDAFFAGHYSGDSSSKSFFVKIDATGTPDTFEWGFDSDVGTEATGIAITSNEQLLDSDYGISINFGTTTGHTIGDKWTGSATALDTDTGFFSNKNEGDAGNGYTHIGVYWDASQNEWTFVGAYDPEPEAPINRSDGSFAYGDIRAKDIYATNVTGTFIGSASQLGGLTSSQFLRSDTADTKTSGDLSFSDNVKAIFGAGSDLQIYHDGNNSLINDTGTGDLRLRTNNKVVIEGNSGEDHAVFNDNGAVQLYFNSGTYPAAKLATTSTGVDITGDVTIPDGSASANRLVLGDGDDAKFFHNGVDTYWMNETGNIVLRNLSDDKDILLQSDDGSGGYATYFAVDGSSGQAQMYYYGSLKLNTNTSGIAVTGNATFADNGKAIFGAGSDLQIYHDGSNSRIQDTATGSLILAGTNFYVNNTGDSKSYLAGLDGGSTPYVRLYYDGATRLDTTSTGVDITGTLTSDGLTVDGDAEVSSNVPVFDFMQSDGTNQNAQLRLNANSFYINQLSDDKTSNRPVALFNVGTGDISFYEDTGTTAKFFWDASAESLGIGTSSPNRLFHIHAASGTNGRIHFSNATTGTTTADGFFIGQDGGDGNVSLWNFENNYLRFATNNAERMRIDGSGNVGIGTSSPEKTLHVNSAASNIGIRVESADSIASIEFIDSGTTSSLLSPRVGGTGDDFFVQTSGSERMRIDSSGNVGIGGTTNSTRKVDIYQTSGNEAGVRVRSTGSGAYYQMFTGTANPKIGSSNNTDQIEFHLGSGEKMRIDSSGNVGIGTSSPDQVLHVEKSVAGGGVELLVGNSGANQSGTYSQVGLGTGGDSTGTAYFRLYRDGSGISELGGYTTQTFYTNNAERMRIDSSGNVNIGVSSGAGTLTIASSGNTGLILRQNTAVDRFKFFVGDGTGGYTVDENFISSNNTNLRFLAGGSGTTEVMQLTSSGNLLVGTTAVPTDDNTALGFGVTSSGEVRASVNGANAAMFKRATSNGDIVEFRKDATKVGSIGTASDTSLVIASTNTGVGFGSTSIAPTNGSLAFTDNQKDLGAASVRWKDLYLSGSIHGDVKFENNAGTTEYARFNSSGNLLVGTTDTLAYNPGARISQQSLVVTNTSATATDYIGYFNRQSSDGIILQFGKANSSVGRIGTTNGDLTIYSSVSGHGGIRFAASGLLPTNDTGALSDASEDIGQSDYRWKDLYLSGGVVLDEAYNTTVTATTATTSQTAIATFAAATYGSAEVMIQAKDGSNRHLTKLLITHNGTTAIATEYGTVVTSSNLATYEVDINSGNVRVLATPASTNSTVFKMTLELIEV